MRRRGSWLFTCVALLAALGASVAFATSGSPLFPIPGFAANRLQVGGVGRLDDGGALIAGSLSDTARPPNWRLVVVRLRLDGSVDLGYGSEGVSTPWFVAGERATSLAIDPNTGDAWVGVAGPRGRGAIVALDEQGSRAQRFGRNGTAGS